MRVQTAFRALGLGILLAASAAWSVAAAPVQVPPPVASDQIALHEINVDQGVATLLETPCGAIMIDAGGRTADDTAHLMAYLKVFFDARPALNNQLAAIFLTHTHIDHDLSLNEVAAKYRPAGFIYNGHLSPKLSGGSQANDMIALTKTSPIIPTVVVNQGTFKTTKKAGYTDAVISPLSCSGVSPKIRVLAGAVKVNPGWTAKEFKNDNSHSLAIRVDFGKASFLFLGDRQQGAQHTLFDAYKGTTLLDVDIYQVAHHGSDNGTDNDTMAALTPMIAVMGVGTDAVHTTYSAWGYGHPRKQAIDALETGLSEARTPTVDEIVATNQHVFSPRPIHKAIYASAWDGDVVITGDAGGHYKVTTTKAAH